MAKKKAAKKTAKKTAKKKTAKPVKKKKAKKGLIAKVGEVLKAGVKRRQARRKTRRAKIKHALGMD